jgi:hypothetical protein
MSCEGASRSLREGDAKAGTVEYLLANKSPPNQPSVLLSKEEEEAMAKKRTFYGGKTDKEHLGGFKHVVDEQGISPNLWNFMMGQLVVKSIVDVGCGIGRRRFSCVLEFIFSSSSC